MTKTKIVWEGASYQSAKSAAVADVRTPDGKLHRLYVKRTEPKARTFRGSIDGLTVGCWGDFELAKTKLTELFENGARNRRADDRRIRSLPREEHSERRGALQEKLQWTIKQIQSAFGTEETGDALVKRALSARAAELELGRLQAVTGHCADCGAELDSTSTRADASEVCAKCSPLRDAEDEAFNDLQRRIAAARGEES